MYIWWVASGGLNLVSTSRYSWQGLAPSWLLWEWRVNVFLLYCAWWLELGLVHQADWLLTIPSLSSNFCDDNVRRISVRWLVFGFCREAVLVHTWSELGTILQDCIVPLPFLCWLVITGVHVTTSLSYIGEDRMLLVRVPWQMFMASISSSQSQICGCVMHDHRHSPVHVTVRWNGTRLGTVLKSCISSSFWFWKWSALDDIW